MIDEFESLNRHSIKCRVCKGPHPTYHCCGRCNTDTHLCSGCGEQLEHGIYVCGDCADD